MLCFMLGSFFWGEVGEKQELVRREKELVGIWKRNLPCLTVGFSTGYEDLGRRSRLAYS